MKGLPTNIVVIHDGLIGNNDPLLVALRIEFGDSNINYFKNSDEGLKYVLSNLSQKMVVLVDINFSDGEKSGIQVFEEIRKKTSLIFVIMITARSLSEISNDYLISMINNDALALENVSNYPKIVELVREAVNKLEIRVDSVIEEWIMRHPPEQRKKPLIKTKENRSYTMNEVLESIRHRTEIGIEFEKNLLKLAVDIFSRQKLKGDG